MKINIRVSGMHCASCSTILTRALKKVEGVQNVSVNYSTEKASVDFNQKKNKI